jgi:hypothetical protein
MNRVPPARLVLAFTAALAAIILTTAGCASRATGPEKQQQRIAKELREMSEAVPKAVSDANRAALVQVAIGRLDAELASLRAALDLFEMDLRLLNARRDVSRAQLAERLDLFEVERKAARSRVLDIHLQMATAPTTTAAEWKQLSGDERAALGTVLMGGATSGSGLFHTGRSAQDLRERASVVVQDELRREAVSRNFDTIEKELKATASERTALEKDVLAAFERHGATRGDFEILFARADGLDARARDAFLAQRESLRSRINAEEWTALWAPPKVESIEAFKNYGEKQGQ